MSGSFFRLFTRNRFDLTQDAFRQFFDRHATAGGFVDKIFCVNFVKLSKIANIGEEACGLHCIIEGRSCGIEHSGKVFHNLLSLLDDILSDYKSGFGIKGDLTGGED